MSPTCALGCGRPSGWRTLDAGVEPDCCEVHSDEWLLRAEDIADKADEWERDDRIERGERRTR